MQNAKTTKSKRKHSKPLEAQIDSKARTFNPPPIDNQSKSLAFNNDSIILQYYLFLGFLQMPLDPICGITTMSHPSPHASNLEACIFMNVI